MAIFDNLPFQRKNTKKCVSRLFSVFFLSKISTKYGKCLDFPYFVKKSSKKLLLYHANMVNQLSLDKFPDFVEFKAVLGTDFT